MRGTFVFLLSVMAACQFEAEPQRERGGLFKKVKGGIEVTASAVTAREISEDLTEEGKTVVSDRFEAKAPAKVAIERIFVEEGQQVLAGDPLVKFEDEENRLRLEMARAEQREAEAGLEEANYTQANRDRLLEEEKLSELESEGLDEKIALYQATTDRARVEIELLEHLLENTQINSPVAGIVTKRSVSEGATVEEGDTMLEVVRLSPIHFVFSVPVEVAAVMEKAGEMEVRFPAVGRQRVAGEILSIGAEVGAKRGVEVKLSIPNETGTLKGEMEGEVQMGANIKRKVFPVPESAIERTERSVYVFKVEGDRVRRVPVELGSELGGQPTVVKGLKEGDRVVVSSSKRLKGGETVEVSRSE